MNRKRNFALRIESAAVPAVASLVSQTQVQGNTHVTNTSWELVSLPFVLSPLPNVKASAAAVAGGGRGTSGHFPLEWGALSLDEKDIPSKKEFQEGVDNEHVVKEDQLENLGATAAAASTSSNAEVLSLAMEHAVSSAKPTVAWVEGSQNSDSALLMALAIVPPVFEHHQETSKGNFVAPNESNQLEKEGFLTVRMFRFHQSTDMSLSNYGNDGSNSSSSTSSRSSASNDGGDRNTTRDVVLSYTRYAGHHQNTAAAGAGLTFRRAPPQSNMRGVPSTHHATMSPESHLPQPPRHLPGEEYTVNLYCSARYLSPGIVLLFFSFQFIHIFSILAGDSFISVLRIGVSDGGSSIWAGLKVRSRQQLRRRLKTRNRSHNCSTSKKWHFRCVLQEVSRRSSAAS